MDEFKAYVYLDYDSPITQWNIARGVFHSVDSYTDTPAKGHLSISVANMIINDRCNRMRSELYIEEIRLKYYPYQVSRLRGLFVFDEENLNKHKQNNTWNNSNTSHTIDTPYFKEKYITEVHVASNKVTKVDSNWISEIMDLNCKLAVDAENKIHSYWQGLPCGSNPIWELLVSGCIIIPSGKARYEALKNITSIDNHIVFTLMYAVKALEFDYLEGYAFPIALVVNGGIEVRFYIQLAKTDDPNFTKKLMLDFDLNYLPLLDLSGFTKIFSNEMLEITKPNKSYLKNI